MSMHEPTDDETETETETESNSYTVHHITEADAERAVERFEEKAAAIEAGADDVAASGAVFLQDALLDEATEAAFLVDGEPLGSWLNGRVDRMKVPADD